MPHQVLDRDRPFGGTSSSSSPVSTPTFTSAKAGMYFDSGSVMQQPPVLDQRHRRDQTTGLVME